MYLDFIWNLCTDDKLGKDVPIIVVLSELLFQPEVSSYNVDQYTVE